MNRRIRLQAEYDWYSLWDQSEADYLDPLDLSLSEELAARLRTWEDRYSGNLNRENPRDSGFKCDADRQDFNQEGRELARLIAQELGDAEIEYLEV